MNNKEYRRYGQTSLGKALDQNGGKEFGYDNALVCLIEIAKLKDRPTVLMGLLSVAIRREDDIGLLRLIPIYERSIVDAGYSDILVPDVIFGMVDRYKCPDTEYFTYSPFSGTHSSVPRAMIELYKMIPLWPANKIDSTPVLLSSKEDIIEVIMKYFVLDSDNEEIWDFFLYISSNREIPEKVFELLDKHFRQIQRLLKENSIRRSIMRIRLWNIPDHRKDTLVRTFMFGLASKASEQSIDLMMEAIMPKTLNTFGAGT